MGTKRNKEKSLPSSRQSSLNPIWQDHSSNFRLGFSLCRGQSLRVCIEGYSAVGVPQRFLNDLHVLAVCLQVGCVATPKRMPTNRLLNTTSVSRRTDISAQEEVYRRGLVPLFRVRTPRSSRHFFSRCDSSSGTFRQGLLAPLRLRPAPHVGRRDE